MKKVYCVIFALFISAASFAGGNKTGLFTGVNGSDDIIGNGFYLYMGFGFPSVKATEFNDTKRVSLGFQPSLEFGNQWMFYKTSEFGVGLNVSWLTLSYSSGSEKDFGAKTTNIGFGAFKLGPMASYALGYDIAIDAYFNINPTFIISIPEGGDFLYTYNGLGYTPGARFRFKKLLVGFETTLGSFNYYDLEDPEFKTKISFFNPRVLLGFKF